MTIIAGLTGSDEEVCPHRIENIDGKYQADTEGKRPAVHKNGVGKQLRKPGCTRFQPDLL